MDNSEIKEKLKNSLEMTYVAFWLIIAVITVLIEGLAVILFAARPPFGPNRWMVFGVMAGPVLIPILGFCIWRTISLFRCPGSYHFCRTKLCSPKGGKMRDTIRFLVVLEDADGNQFTAYTHSIFFTHQNSLGLAMEDYINKEVTVGYNEETGVVAVIG